MSEQILLVRHRLCEYVCRLQPAPTHTFVNNLFIIIFAMFIITHLRLYFLFITLSKFLVVKR